MRAYSRLLTAVVSTSLLVAACDAAVPSPSAAPASAPTSALGSPTAFQPTFEEVPCPEDVTSEVVIPASCGYLTVLEDRSKPRGRTIHLFVVRFDPPGGTTTMDPLIALGQLAGRDGYGDMSEGGQRTHRVEYLLDPRGIGHSTPSLDCPEVALIGPDIAGLRLRDSNRKSILLGAVTACRDRLVGQGIDIAAYDLAANASDLEDLRNTLGIARWNINTNGDTSRLAFEVARRFPAGLRSLMIDSPSLPSPNFLTLGPASLDVAIGRLVSLCAADPDCAREFPDLAAMIRNASAQLDANPAVLDVTGTVMAITLGHPIRVQIDGAALIRIMRFGLANQGGSAAVRILRTVRTVIDGTLSADNPDVIALASDVGDCFGIFPSCDEGLHLGALYSIVCRDLAPEVDDGRLRASLDGRAAYADVFSPSPLLAPCDAWGVPPAQGIVPEPLTGGVPTLILHGALDPYSATATDIAAAAGDAANLYVIDVPNQSYNALGWTECPRTIRNAWIDALTSPPADTTCLASIPPIDLAP